MSNHLGQIYSTTKNAEKYIVLNSQNVELSGNVKLTNGNLDVSQNLIFNNFSVTDKINFRVNSGSTSYNIINNSLTANNDASFNNVEISGTIKLPDSSNNGYGVSGQVLQSNADNSPPSWVTPTMPNQIVAGSSINAGIYNYINFKEVVNSSTTYTRYDFFSVPHISGIITVRLMKLKIQTEYWNEAALYQEEIVRWNDATGEITGLNVVRIDNVDYINVSISNTSPALNGTNSGKIWVWEDNNNVYVSFINGLNRSYRILIQMELFNVRHANGGVAVVL